MINVTKTFLPPQEEYQAILKCAWETGWMTNRGVLVRELEAQLQSHLGVTNLIAMTNGTLPLQIAIKALGLKGEIITTPFSYVATTSSIVWEGCTPVFVDIHPEYLTIDETKIEAAITPNTSAILATHVFGNPCNIEAIQIIADKYNLKVIYDAAHCFGVTYKGKSIFEYGDVSTCSFHATKLFHTGEGGALFCKPEFYDDMFYHHNFGHDGAEAFHGLGINAKMSEPQAAMGLAVFSHITEIMSTRSRAVKLYDEILKETSFQRLKIREGTLWNNSYYPIIFNSESELLQVQRKMNTNHIYPRRYFYPSLNCLPYIENVDCKITESISSRILCLPLWAGMENKIINQISKFLI
ncbi:DegT/DnrJ/EryC1/StrS aminotransferase [Formosa agariphila KMM 3901]|uniref:DegT/DnrJ/EryC1/StrS aminotransferase n=1 Tax=Formosa agariphila (strain DSM 15362 / KCTC 12365 / LMG 23005 / KMM 3901 / M-2Alg 35-1) TaxID=1347342 RepID=T2KPX3_FORAG|nr:DegT/DnrJ/EryC1/StrS family aminotransferase [Formosa agariphila]CDF80039.1 DegT/DnrJ/EryC1/StrS aminotransferase [Formosa agariphila KMM 3901]